MSCSVRAAFSFAFLSALSLFAAGCASTYELKVEAIARSESTPRAAESYRIEDRTPIGGTHVLRNKEIADLLRTALSAHGLYEAPDSRAADLVVEIAYGIGPERVQQTVYQRLSNGRPVPATEERGPAPTGVAREMMGYAELTDTRVLREKFLSLRAHESQPREVGRPTYDVWSVDVSMEDEGGDLRGHLPLLLTAAMDRIGRSTDGTVAVTLRSDDPAVRFVRRGM